MIRRRGSSYLCVPDGTVLDHSRDRTPAVLGSVLNPVLPFCWDKMHNLSLYMCKTVYKTVQYPCSAQNFSPSWREWEPDSIQQEVCVSGGNLLSSKGHLIFITSFAGHRHKIIYFKISLFKLQFCCTVLKKKTFTMWIIPVVWVTTIRLLERVARKKKRLCCYEKQSEATVWSMFNICL